MNQKFKWQWIRGIGIILFTFASVGLLNSKGIISLFLAAIIGIPGVFIFYYSEKKLPKKEDEPWYGIKKEWKIAGLSILIMLIMAVVFFYFIIVK